MRDRMILYRDQFDLDDCFRCLLSGSVFHGGDPAIAGNWQLPSEFFEKYWFLTIDYNLRRYTNEWRKLQGLKEINPDIIPNDKQQPVFNQQTEPGLSYQDLSGYLGVQINTKNQQQEQEQDTILTPIQLMNGYGITNTAASGNQKPRPAQPSSSPWDSIMMGQKNYGKKIN